MELKRHLRKSALNICNNTADVCKLSQRRCE